MKRVIQFDQHEWNELPMELGGAILCALQTAGFVIRKRKPGSARQTNQINGYELELVMREALHSVEKRSEQS